MAEALLGIVTVSYNTRDLLRQCLDSGLASLARSQFAADWVVVDNASADGSAALVCERYPQVKLISNERNAGFAAATNQGLRALGFPGPQGPRYALLLNPDTIVHGEALARLVAFMEGTPQAAAKQALPSAAKQALPSGACGARLVYEDGSFQHSAFRFPTLFMVFLDFYMPNWRLLDSRLNGRYPRRLYAAGEPFAIDHPLGAALMVRREAAQQVGLLDEQFFMYSEEVDWCRRIKGAGWGIYCVPQAEIVHLAGRSAQQFREEMFVALWRSRYRYYAKHHSPLYRRAVRLIVGLGLERAEARVREQVRRGELPRAAAEKRLAAYTQVRALGRELA